MIWVIKTTVAILDTGTCKHQCVTMRTKDFRECLFFKRFVYQGSCKRFRGSRPLLGIGSGSNYLKN